MIVAEAKLCTPEQLCVHTVEALLTIVKMNDTGMIKESAPDFKDL